MGPRNWEEAINELVEEKIALWECLDNIVALWDMEASMSEIENAVGRAKAILANTKEELK
jgi:hypothetical protein